MPPRRTRASVRKQVGSVAPDPVTQNQEEETAGSSSKVDSSDVSALQKARIENNRLKAIQLRKTKKEAEDRKATLTKKLKQTVPRELDTGAGFFVEEEEDGDGLSTKEVDYQKLIANEPFVIEGDGNDVECEECCRPFTLSFLKSKFNHNICDKCHDRDTHKLITRTTAKTKYLLKDADLDKREPVLLYITKKNPRDNRWGEMKLYLESQCYNRAMEIWGSMEAIEEESTKRKILNVKAKAKKYDKKMNELKKEVRSSLYKVQLSGHTHEWGEETYDESSDEYTKQCTTCGHSMTYEKM